jgi:hypothetical protein
LTINELLNYDEIMTIEAATPTLLVPSYIKTTSTISRVKMLNTKSWKNNSSNAYYYSKIMGLISSYFKRECVRDQIERL